MLELVIGAALAQAPASNPRVGLAVGPDRYVSATLPSSWTPSVDTAERRCWKRGAGEVCLFGVPAKGATPQGFIDAEKAKFTVQSCTSLPPAPSPAAAVAECLVRDGLQDQSRYWSVVVDGEHAAGATVMFTADDPAAFTEASAFIQAFSYAGPLLLTTLGKPECKALRTVLVASVGGFTSITGEATTSAHKSTFAWPGGLTNEVITDAGQPAYKTTIALKPTPDAALAEAQTFLTAIGACDSWCAPMTTTESSTPTQRVVSISPQSGAEIAPLRCSTAPARVVIAQQAPGMFDVTFVVNAAR